MEERSGFMPEWFGSNMARGSEALILLVSLPEWCSKEGVYGCTID
jgi:hypothetical protein